MGNLLKLQFYRVIRDKAMIIQAAITLGISFIYVALYFLIGKMMSDPSLGESSSTVFIFSTSSLILLSFQQTSVPLLMVGVMCVTYIAKEVRFGTIRNQVVSGYSKRKIFFADTIFISIIALSIIIVYQLLTIVEASIFGFPFFLEGQEIGYFFLTYAMGWIVSIVYIAFVCFVAMNIQQMGLAIMLCVLVPTLGYFVVTMLTSLDQNILLDSTKRGILDFVYFFQTMVVTGQNVATQIQDSGSTETIKLIDNIFIIASVSEMVVYSSLFLFFGQLWFSKRDLK